MGRIPWLRCKAIPRSQEDEGDEGDKPNDETDEKDKDKTDDGNTGKDKTEDGNTDDTAKKEEKEIQKALEKANQTAGVTYCLKAALPNTNRKIECGEYKIGMKWIDFRKIIVYVIFIVLYNIMFNWAILLYMGHGYHEAMTLDWNSPSRHIVGYLQHVLNSIHTMVEFVNMLF